MRQIQTLFASITIAAAACLPLAGFAQKTDDMTRGEVRKVDKDTGKITIKHEEIKSLDMPPMTMVFIVKDRSQLEQVQPGQKVVFAVAREDGALVIKRLQPLPLPNAP